MNCPGRGPVSVAEAVQIASEVGNTFVILGHQGVVHRDISLSILVRRKAGWTLERLSKLNPAVEGVRRGLP